MSVLGKRVDLLALTPASLAALANKGLVKRAQKELLAGKSPALTEDADGLVIGTFEDGVVTRFPPGTAIASAPCSCGASTMCRHRIAVVLAYGAVDGATHDLAKESAPVLAPSFSDSELSTFVGKRTFGRAHGMSMTVDLESGGVAKLASSTVVFHVPSDLALARCDCKATRPCEHIVLAAWAFREAERSKRTPPCTIELAPSAEEIEVRSLDLALELVELVVHEGVTHVAANSARFARVRAALSKEKLLWPGVLVDDLEKLLEAYRARSSRYRTGDLVFVLASLEARRRAARGDGELPARYVLGTDIAPSIALDRVRFIALGARIEADGESREARVFLAEPDSGAVLVASRAFADAREDGPALARRRMSGAVTLGALAAGQVVTRAAIRHANHEVSFANTRGEGQTSVVPSAGDWDELPPSLLVRDAASLADELARRPPHLLRPRMVAAQMKVLAVSRARDVAYRPGDEELIALLGDELPIRLSRRHSRAAPLALDVAARALMSDALRFVAGDVRLGPRGLELDPTAIVTDRVIVPDLERTSPFVDSLPRVAVFAPEPAEGALQAASALLEEALHDGLSRLRSGFVGRAAAAAKALANVGFSGAESRILAFARAPSPRTWLDLAIRLQLTWQLLRE